MLKILCSAAALLALALPAVAQEPPAGGPPPRPDFATLDANHDGELSVSEFSAPMQARAQAMFTQMDADHDGAVTEAEFRAFRPEGPPEGLGGERREHGERRIGPPPLAFKTLDADGDGKVSFAEFSAREKTRFDRLDVNHDGALEPSELAGAQMGGPMDGPPGGPDNGHDGDLPPQN